MYDFILFENNRFAINHCKDVCIIANLLIRTNHKVAILDVWNEPLFCQIDGVRHIKVPGIEKALIPNTSRILILWRFVNTINNILWCCRLKKALLQIKNQYRNLYVGSYNNKMLLFWIRKIDTNTNAYFWGLRSFWLHDYKHHPYSLQGINSFFLNRYFKNHSNIKFFVSNEIIKNEFEEIGFGDTRTVIRPERIANNLCATKFNNTGDIVNILSVGSLRADKRIELIIDAVKSFPEEILVYTIAGKASDSYEIFLRPHYRNIPNIIRRNARISEEDYIHLIQYSDFLILCDVKQPSCVTNGTMNEALLNGTPIIAPNYQPYLGVVEKYDVGILFDPNIKSSIEQAISKAIYLGKRHFEMNLYNYQQSLLIDNVAKVFASDIRKLSK